MLSGDRNKWLNDNSFISFSHEYIESKHSQSKLHWKRGFGKYTRLSRSGVSWERSTQVKIAQVVTALLVKQCCNNTVIMAEQCCSTKNVIYYCFNNVVQRTMLLNEQCSLLFQQCCWTNNVVHYCFNNVVHHWMKQQRLLKQEKTILIEQACSLLLSLLLYLVNKL